MKRFLSFALLVVWTFAGSAVCAQAPVLPSPAAASPNANFDPPSFATELRRIATVLKATPSNHDMAALRDSLPKQWMVSTPHRTYSISSQPLDKLLAMNSAAAALAWVNHLAEQIEAYNAPADASFSTARSELDRILAQREFAAVRPPSAWDRLRERISAWIERQIIKIMEAIGQHPIAGKLVFWVLILVGVALIALWVFRFLERRDRLYALPPSEIITASRTWQEWIHHARDAAARGDFREAVHSCYWAGIVRLEDAGIVPKDRSKTPREYLRLVTEPHAYELSSRPTYREPLASLTSRLERIWYANRPATSEDFRESLRQLEALGCPLE
jgi:Domain of unknown function (DUF4129)